ncbi:MAG: transposase [Myxococcales bacterium]|nr:transposase [Myxococcales bacterium]
MRAIKSICDEVLKKISPQLSLMHSSHGRLSIPSERLLKGMLLVALYSTRSEAQFCEQLYYNLLYRWFLDMDML